VIKARNVGQKKTYKDIKREINKQKI
jgi:hypothetical protein